MSGDKEWRELCEQASKELDPDKLMKLVERINQAFEKREKELRESRNPGRAKPDSS